MKQGEGFRFQCKYQNTEDRALRFGTSATDEMCILLGLAWNAGAERDIPWQSCAITYVDDAGLLDCVQDPTRECTEVIDTNSSTVGLLQQVRGCMGNSGCADACATQ
jgi:hypothetical protein